MNRGASFFVILTRTLHSKCPICGRGRLFARALRIREFSEIFLPLRTCAACGFQFARQPGYYFGVVTPVLPILALMMGALFAACAYFGFQQAIDRVLLWSLVGVIAGFFISFRTAIAVYLALDHAIDPPQIDPEK